MTYSIKLLPVVKKDLQQAKLWYKNINQNLADDFKKEVSKEINYISNNPEHYQKKYKELRQSIVHRFPYAIFYFVHLEKNQIVIVGVLHTSRNPASVNRRF